MSAPGTDDFLKAARALNEAGDRKLRLGVYKGFRAAAKPLGQEMVTALGESMPKRGGLAARVAASKVGIRNATTGNNPRVEIALRSAQGYKLKPMDEGNLRHPVFARQGQKKRTWVRQSVPSGAATRAFEAGAPAVRRRIVSELTQVIDDTAKKG